MTERRRGSEKSEQREGDRPAQPAAPPIWEWVVAAMGGALVVAVLGFMAYEATTLSDHPMPKLTVRIDTVASHAGGHVVEFRVGNSGDATAADVLIQGELRSDVGVLERSEATIGFVPARSWRTGGLVFTNDPRRHRMEVRAVGFERP
jgi:uncharacterized protein (TIGR02588 family)